METFNFGKYKGKTFEEVFEKHKSYVTWVKNLENPTGSLIEFKNYVLRREEQGGDSGDTYTEYSEYSNKYGDTNNYGNDNYYGYGNKYKTDKSQNGSFNYKQNGYDNKNSVNKMNSSEHKIYEQNIMNQIANRYNNKEEEKPELDIIVAFEIFNNDSFKIVQKDNNNKKYSNFKNFVPKELFKILSEFNPTLKKINNYSCVTFESDKYEYVLNNLAEKCTILGGIHSIPNFLLKCFQNYSKFSQPQKISEVTANILTNTMCSYTKEHYDDLNFLLGEKLAEELKNFQKEGIDFGLKKNGRVLIGDEMGLGKTLQALALMAFYNKDWPFIVVCPSSIRFQWKDQALRWLPHLIEEKDICVIKSGKMDIPRNTKMIIISYELITKNDKYQNKYKCIVCDESHYLKNSFSKRTKAIVPIIKSAKRCVLLSGTPALNKPSELYEQVSSIIPNLFNYNEFCDRYCYKDKNIYTRKIEYVGCKHTEELHLFLTNTIMIRRLKKDVLKELPDKLRSKIPIEIPQNELSEILIYSKKLESKKNININDLDNISLSRFNDFNSNHDNNIDEENITISQLFKMTGYAKVKAIKEYITYLIDADIKFLLFCHHKLVMDEIDEFLKEKKLGFIRVDGLTPIDKREIYIKNFQSDEKIRIAILSITACGVGLNLTAANTVVFGELYWVPGQMIQAEDRAHRIGTTHDTINIHYLVAQNTIDEVVWKIINRKWNTLTTALNGAEDSLNVKEVSKFDKFMLDLTNDTNKSYPTSLVNTPKINRRSAEYKALINNASTKKYPDIRDFFKKDEKNTGIERQKSMDMLSEKSVDLWQDEKENDCSPYDSTNKYLEKSGTTLFEKKRANYSPSKNYDSDNSTSNILTKKYKTEII
ncbi:DNA helicase, putative [Plasmodium vinckei lentum]|uniref:DNA helicase, putative n=1 Tax=Plasmodium vinckei lentum TaxID=138297 RepID=A0A6V7SCC2_PLAVN|nr:DNA helicase, putative [Plasmodium vinckei lentum]